MSNSASNWSCVIFLLFWFGGAVTPFHLQAQTNPTAAKTPRAPTLKKNDAEKVIDTAAIEEQERQFAVSRIMAIADEARSYKDLTLRPSDED
jgi:hypothetical protein